MVNDSRCALSPEVPLDEPARHGERPEDLPPPYRRQRGEWHLQGRKCELRENTTGSTAATGLPSGVNCPECMEAMAPVTVGVDFRVLLEGLDSYPGGLELNFRLRGTVFYGVTHRVRDMQVVSASEGWRERHPSDAAKDDAEQWLGVTTHHIDAVEALVESACKVWRMRGVPA